MLIDFQLFCLFLSPFLLPLLLLLLVLRDTAEAQKFRHLLSHNVGVFRAPSLHISRHNGREEFIDSGFRWNVHLRAS